MTWILPKQLHTLVSALDTEALILDLNEQSQICGQSLLARSKPSPVRTWLLRWKRENWTQHLSGRILKPSLGQSFVEKWTSSLVDTPVNHSPPLASDLELKTPDISGPSSQMELDSCSPEFASLRTSKDTSASDSEQSLKNWEASVTKRRGAYSARVKLAHLTKESGCLSWPTPQTGEDKVCMTGTQNQRMLSHAVVGLVALVSTSTDGSRQESWATPSAFDGQRPTETMEEWKIRNAKKKEQNPNLGTLHKPLTVQVTEQKNRPELLWPTHTNTGTGRVSDGKRGRDLESCITNPQAWATPRANKVHPEITEKNREQLATRNKSNLEEEIAGHCGTATGKLNPRWVETLMGLPVGWTMPSCASPVTIELTSCASLATESFRLQQH